MARFSFAGGEPVPATVAPRGWLPGQQGDLALLELDRDPPPAARPAPLRPARAVTGHGCTAYGYPPGLDGGVWSEPEITGQTVDRLQLTAQVVQGHQIEKGFSGHWPVRHRDRRRGGPGGHPGQGQGRAGRVRDPAAGGGGGVPAAGSVGGLAAGHRPVPAPALAAAGARGVPGHHAGLVFHRPDRAAAGADRVAGAGLAGPGGAGGDRPGRDRQVGGAGVAVRAQRPAAARRDRRPPARPHWPTRPPSRQQAGSKPRCGPAAWTPTVPPGRWQRRWRCRWPPTRRPRMCWPLSGILARPSGAAWWWCWTRWTRHGHRGTSPASCWCRWPATWA